MESDIVKYVSDGFEQAKNGDASSIYDNVIQIFKSGQLPLKSHYAFGWIIYYAIHKMPSKEVAQRKRMLAEYLKLNVPKPHKLHSMILTEAIRLYKDVKNAASGKKIIETFSIVKFSDLWGLMNLRPGDWRRKEYEGRELSSTVEKLITIYVDELESKCMEPSDDFMKLFNEALGKYPDSFNLLSQKASLLLQKGEIDESRDLLRKALLFAPGKFFLWSRLAALFSVDENPRLHVALLYKALSCPGPDQFKGKIHCALAEAFVRKEQYQYARWELNHVKKIYETNAWHLPKIYSQTMAQIPVDTIASDPVVLYKKLESLAENEVYKSLPIIKVTKTYHKAPDPLKPSIGNNYGKSYVAWRVTDSDGNNFWFQPHRYNIPVDLPIGTPLNIRVHNSRLVKAELP